MRIGAAEFIGVNGSRPGISRPDGTTSPTQYLASERPVPRRHCPSERVPFVVEVKRRKAHRRGEKKHDADRKHEPEDCRHGRHPGWVAPRRDPGGARTRRGPIARSTVSTWSAVRVSRRRLPGSRPSSTRPPGPRPTRRRRRHSSPLGAEPAASRRRSRGEADRRRLDHRHRQVPGRLQRGEGGAGADLLEGPLPVRIVRAAQFHEFVDPLVGWMIQDGVATCPRCNAARRRPRRRRGPRRRGRGAGDRERQDHRGRRPAGGASRRCGSSALRQPR